MSTDDHDLGTWEVSKTEVPSGSLYRVLAGGSCLSVRQFFELLRTSDAFADWYSATLAASDTEAFYWELPPLTVSTLGDDAEFVLIDAPMLSRLPPDPVPFAGKFDSKPADGIVVFPNLGGDAVLVVPCPESDIDVYPHLAVFLRRGRVDQVRALWQTAAETLLDMLSDTPIWLSTAGLGVAWLHLRLDSRPKYYSYRPYAETD